MRRFKHILLILALAVLVAPAAPPGASSARAETPVPEVGETSAESQVIIKWYGYWDYVWGDCDFFCSWFKSNPFCDCEVIYIKIP